MRNFATLLGCLVAFTCLAEEVQVTSLRMWPAPDHTRVVFDISGPVEHRLFTLADPDRVVIDILGASAGASGLGQFAQSEVIARIRSAPRNTQDLRVVLDLKGVVRPKSFLLRPNASYGHRLVIDLFPTANEQNAEPRVVKQNPGNGAKPRDIVIAIDPGHGGEDPGAQGPKGAREKDVTMAVARKLAAVIDRVRGMQAVLIRSGDYYVGLRKRMMIARHERADLFVSIHADAFRDPRVRGSAVYILSRNGASSEAARWLAEQENAADLAGGVSLDDKDDLLASVLLDLSQTATLSASTEVGKDVLMELKRLGKPHKISVQRADFMVLKSPDIPSILVEAAFISNPDEERKLTDAGHQDALARSVLKGISNYFEQHAPPGTLLALKRHVIESGDTLSDIADRYQVSVNSLRSANSLNSDQLQVGQVLHIPIGS